jgi:hypothetical protein
MKQTLTRTLLRVTVLSALACCGGSSMISAAMADTTIQATGSGQASSSTISSILSNPAQSLQNIIPSSGSGSSLLPANSLPVNPPNGVPTLPALPAPPSPPVPLPANLPSTLTDTLHGSISNQPPIKLPEPPSIPLPKPPTSLLSGLPVQLPNQIPSLPTLPGSNSGSGLTLPNLPNLPVPLPPTTQNEPPQQQTPSPTNTSSGSQEPVHTTSTDSNSASTAPNNPFSENGYVADTTSPITGMPLIIAVIAGIVCAGLGLGWLYLSRKRRVALHE